MGGFDVPDGDPGALRQTARAALAAATTVADTRRNALAAATSTAMSALPTRRVTDFSGARDAATKTLDTVAMSLTSIGGALSAYAGALEDAQDRVRAAKVAWEDAHTGWLGAQRSADTAAADRHRAEKVHQEDAADHAHRDLRDRAAAAAAVLAGEVHVWVPQGAGSPVDAWAAASSNILPARLHVDPARLKDAYKRLEFPKDLVSETVKAAMKGWQGWQLAGWLRAPSIAARAEEEFAKYQLNYELIKNTSPNLGDPATYRAYLIAERDMLNAFRQRWPTDALRAQREFGFLRGIVGDTKAVERLKVLYPGLSDIEITGTAARLAQMMGPLRAVGPWASRVLAPVGVVAGGVEVWGALTDHAAPDDVQWARGVAGLGSVAAGGATLLVMAGLVSNPVGWSVIVVGSVAAIGGWAYENRQAITHALAGTGHAIVDGADHVGDEINAGVDWAADRVGDAGGAVKDTAGKVWHGIFG